MPAIGKPIVLPSGDSMELLETSAMTNGERVRARIIFGATGARVAAHLHLRQDETYEVISGTLTYLLDGRKHQAPAGTIVHLARGVPHQHYSEGPQDAVTIQTMTPGLDFDYLLETVFGLRAEGKLKGAYLITQGLVMQRKMEAAFALAVVPVWVQTSLAWIVTPFAYLLGFRAVHQRFSGEEW